MSSKFVLPQQVGNSHIEEPVSMMSDFVMVRARWTRRELKQINVHKATGPDLLPARILKTCADELAVPLTILIRKILHEGCWPNYWKNHWIMPVFKKGSVSDPTKYRGIHLTSVLSKTVERVLGLTLVQYLDHVGAFGQAQWAFRKGHSCRDLVTVVVCNWLLGFHEGQKIGIYDSDISGAFDRVETERLLSKCRRAGLNKIWLLFLSSYLSPRTAHIIVNGAKSEQITIKNMVYQGTVLGPPLWNTFFSDVKDAAESSGATAAMFADDLVTYKRYDRQLDNSLIFDDLHECQAAVHEWGGKNQVAFDPSKEEFVILDPVDGCGNDFRLLGPWIDNKLLMKTAVSKITNKAKPKLKALLRTRPYYNTTEMFNQYKCHVLNILESCTGAIYHASTSLLDTIDRVQTSFLHPMEVTTEEAFLKHNLAPLCLRRDIAMLGFIFKSMESNSHPSLRALFPRAVPEAQSDPRTRLACRRHSRQLHDRCDGRHSDRLGRSIFGLVKVFNLLPQDVVDAQCVKTFQTRLTERARLLCRADHVGWALHLNPRAPFYARV